MGNYYLTVSADADDIVKKPVAVATSAVIADVSAAAASGSFVVVSALPGAPNSRILKATGGGAQIVVDTTSIDVESVWIRTGTSPQALGLSGNYEQVSAMQLCGTASGALLLTHNHSAGQPEACPMPNPYIWVSSSDSTATTSGYYGSGASLVGASSTGSMEWDYSESRLVVSSAGVYRVLLTGVMTTAANQNVVLALFVNDVQQHIAGEYVHGLVDPDVVSLDWVGFMSAGDNLRLQHTSGSNANFTLGSTLTVTRIA
jgi:hypothetical protein